MALNKVMLIGNVGNDPEVRYLESNPQNPGGNVKVASFRLATTERYRDRSGELRENTEWHSIVVWRNNADVVEKFVHKGSQVYIEGKLRTRQWTDQTGAKRYTTEVVADNLQLLGKRPDSEGNSGYQGGYGPGYQGGAQPSGGSAPAGGMASSGGSAPASGMAPAGGYQPSSMPAGFQPSGAAGSAPVGPNPVSGAGPAGGSGPAGTRGVPGVPGVNPAYQGPLPAAEPADDLPF